MNVMVAFCKETSLVFWGKTAYGCLCVSAKGTIFRAIRDLIITIHARYKL